MSAISLYLPVIRSRCRLVSLHTPFKIFLAEIVLHCPHKVFPFGWWSPISCVGAAGQWRF